MPGRGVKDQITEVPVSRVNAQRNIYISDAQICAFVSMF